MSEKLTEALVVQLNKIIQTRLESDRLIVPAMPQVASRCLTLLKDPGVANRKLVAVLETDPLFAAQVSRAASTAAFGGQPARTLDAAISRLGTNTLRIVITEASARSLFKSRDKQISGRLQEVWRHSVAVAILARDVAGLMQAGDTPVDASVVYLTGLLHDVGKTVVAALLLEAEAQLGKQGWINADQWSRVVSACHRPVGIAVAEKWNLDPEVVSAVRDCDEYDAHDRGCAANVVRFANALVKLHGVSGGHVEPEEVEAMVMIGRSMLDLDEDAVDALARGLKERVDGALAA
jgi:putative nucleotidyltransferase with HDIG domain